MGIWTVYDADVGRALLMDSVTERPLPMHSFETREGADDFVAWCMEAHGDPRKVGEMTLDLYVQEWRGLVCRACWERDCACPGCGNRCSRTCPAECSFDREVKALGVSP
jgi:hypothetical protein